MTVCIVIVLIVAVISLDCGALTRRVLTGTADYVILIDPGHGGMDGGASSNDGTLEKDINLEIAQELSDAAEWYGCRTIMTRETDEWLCETDEGTIRSRKTADLNARREMIRKFAPDLTVSIHLNSFKEDPGVHGAQVFYPETGGEEQVMQECRMLADTVQESLNNTLQPEDSRNAMVRDGVFIFKEVERPVIIVECGFMSNQEEIKKLKSDEYQNELAQCIMAGIAAFAGISEPQSVEILDSLS